MARPSGLGRGLGALIPADVETDDGERVLRDIPVADIIPNQYQPRGEFDEEQLLSLSESIRELGVLQPILVRRGKNNQYELIAGERRWRAARRAGLAAVPAIVREVDDDGSLEQALVENLHRVDLNALDEAAAYQQLIDDFSFSQDQVAKRVGRSRSAVANTLRLMQLPPTVQRMLRDGELSAGHARALLGNPERDFQEKLANRISAEGLSVRAVENEVRSAASPSGSGTGKPKKRARSKSAQPAGVLELEGLLGDHLETRVDVTMSSSRNRILIDVADLDDLERVCRLILDGGRASPRG